MTASPVAARSASTSWGHARRLEALHPPPDVLVGRLERLDARRLHLQPEGELHRHDADPWPRSRRGTGASAWTGSRAAARRDPRVRARELLPSGVGSSEKLRSPWRKAARTTLNPLSVRHAGRSAQGEDRHALVLHRHGEPAPFAQRDEVAHEELEVEGVPPEPVDEDPSTCPLWHPRQFRVQRRPRVGEGDRDVAPRGSTNRP